MDEAERLLKGYRSAIQNYEFARRNTRADLVQRLRSVNAETSPYANEVVRPWCNEAADRIEAQAREIAWLTRNLSKCDQMLAGSMKSSDLFQNERDAAIKRVGELEGTLKLTTDEMKFQTKFASEQAAIAEKAETDLAAARADIERKDTIIELVKQDHAAMNARLVDALIEIERRGAALREITERRPLDVMAASYIAAKALAPKETNNG
jgi:hypothetical protein